MRRIRCGRCRSWLAFMQAWPLRGFSRLLPRVAVAWTFLRFDLLGWIGLLSFVSNREDGRFEEFLSGSLHHRL